MSQNQAPLGSTVAKAVNANSYDSIGATIKAGGALHSAASATSVASPSVFDGSSQTITTDLVGLTPDGDTLGFATSISAIGNTSGSILNVDLSLGNPMTSPGQHISTSGLIEHYSSQQRDINGKFPNPMTATGAIFGTDNATDTISEVTFRKGSEGKTQTF